MSQPIYCGESVAWTPPTIEPGIGWLASLETSSEPISMVFWLSAAAVEFSEWAFAPTTIQFVDTQACFAIENAS
jgi:hypothetical protein